MIDGKLTQPDAFWSQIQDNLLASLHGTTDGPSTPDARGRLEQFGPNSLAVKERATPLSPQLLLALGVIAVLYIIASEATKRAFYRRAQL